MFELLDDPAAGPPPASFRAAVTRRVHRRRRRQALAAGSLAAVSALGIGTLVARDRVRPEQVHVAGLPSAEPSADDPVTVLLVGVDSGLREEAGARFTDTIVLARIDPVAGQVRLLPVPRDLAVTVEGGDRVRINTLVATGGRDLLVRAIRDELGIDVHRYVETDVAGAVEIVDALGGLQLSVDAPVRAASTGLELPAGCSTLTGEQVAALGRARRDLQVQRDDASWTTDATGDLGRQSRAAAIATALLRAVGRVDAADLPGLVATGLDGVVVDAATDAEDVLALGRVAARSEVLAVWLPVRPAELPDGQQVLVLSDDAGDAAHALEGGDQGASGIGSAPGAPADITGLAPC